MLNVQDAEKRNFTGKPFAFHIGLKRFGNGSEDFLWDDGTRLTNATAWWADHEPSNPTNENVIMGKVETSTSDFKWRTVDNVEARFICEKNKGAIMGDT